MKIHDRLVAEKYKGRKSCALIIELVLPGCGSVLRDELFFKVAKLLEAFNDQVIFDKILTGLRVP